MDKGGTATRLAYTVLKLMGFNHAPLTCRYAGRDFGLTDVHGQFVDERFA